MKFFKWLASLFIPTKCKVELESKEKDALSKLLDKGINGFELGEHLGASLWRMLSDTCTMYPETISMSPQDTIEFVLNKFKEKYPDVKVEIAEHNKYFIEFDISFQGKKLTSVATTTKQGVEMVAVNNPSPGVV